MTSRYKFYALRCLGTSVDQLFVTKGDTYLVKVPAVHDNYFTKGRLRDDLGEEVFLPLFFLSDAVSYNEVSERNGWRKVQCTSRNLREFSYLVRYLAKRCEDDSDMLMVFDSLGKLREVHESFFTEIVNKSSEETFVSFMDVEACFPLPEFEVFDEKGIDFEIEVEDNQLISYGDDPVYGDQVSESFDVDHEYSKYFVANYLKELKRRQ